MMKKRVKCQSNREVHLRERIWVILLQKWEFNPNRFRPVNQELQNKQMVAEGKIIRSLSKLQII
jgi:hypothetical protein